MKERPIIFNSEMIRALVDGRKTQTRRPLKSRHLGNGDWACAFCENGMRLDGLSDIKCPYGKIGDRLWVKETWSPDPNADHDSRNTCTESKISFVEWNGCGQPIDQIPVELRNPKNVIYKSDWRGGDLIWTPAIHMTRWASRITLEITGIRIERVRDITKENAIGEGVCFGDGSDSFGPIEAFIRLWNSIYEFKGLGWDANPWVWVIEFKMMEIKQK